MSTPTARNLTLDVAVADVEARYVAANPNSQARYQRALGTMPGANTRTTLWLPADCADHREDLRP